MTKAKHAKSELGQKHYTRADRLLEEILPELKRGAEILLPGDKKAKLKDNFAEGKRFIRPRESRAMNWRLSNHGQLPKSLTS